MYSDIKRKVAHSIHCILVLKMQIHSLGVFGLLTLLLERMRKQFVFVWKILPINLTHIHKRWANCESNIYLQHKTQCRHACHRVHKDCAFWTSSEVILRINSIQLYWLGFVFQSKASTFIHSWKSVVIKPGFPDSGNRMPTIRSTE